MMSFRLYSQTNNLIGSASNSRVKQRMIEVRKESENIRAWLVMLGALLLLSGFSLQARAQTPTPQSSPGPGQTTAKGPNQTPDLADLNLTQDQIQKIRAINAELKNERQAARQRLQQAQHALNEAIESPNPDEALIEQR